MRLAIACDTFPPDVNGAAVFTSRLASGLAKRGHKVAVISPSPTGYSFIESSEGVDLYRVPSWRYPWHPSFRIADFRRASRAVVSALNDVQPDVIHIQSHFVVGRVAALESSNANTPLIATNHFMPDNLRSHLPFRIPDPIYKILTRFAWRDLYRVFRYADLVTAPTACAVKMLVEHSNLKAIPISCGIDIESYVCDARASKRPGKRILFVGRLDAEKRIDEIVNALPYLGPEYKLRIVGTGAVEPKLRHLVSDLGVQDRVRFLGYLTDEQLKAEYSSADVFCMPGRAELQSIATLEAMASGLPIVAVKANALPLLVEDGVNGFLYKAGDLHGLAYLLEHVVSDTERWRGLSAASEERARNHEISLTISNFEAAYQGIRQIRSHSNCG